MNTLWQEKKLGEVCEFKYGKNLPDGTRVAGPYPVFGSSSQVSFHKDFHVEGPGIIVGRKGTVGKVQYTKSNFFPIDTTFYVEVKDKNTSDMKFLYYRLGLCGLSEMNSDAAVPGLNRNAALSLKVMLPPLQTQQKIAKILSAYDDLIEINQNRIILLEEMARITYEEWFVRMRFHGHESSPAIPETGLPEGWGNQNINVLYRIKYGNNLPQTAISDSGKYPVYGAAGVMGYYHESNANKKIALITSRGNGSADVHRTYEAAFVTNNSFLVLPNKGFEHLELAFTINLLKLAGLKSFCSGAAQPQLTNDALKGLKVILPNKPIIEAYNRTVMPAYEAADNLRVQNQYLREARDILLPRLMTGIIDAESYGPIHSIKESA